MIKINTNTTTKAICPFCRNHIVTKRRILNYINLTDNKELLTDLLSQNINYVKCPKCGESFYFEHNCLALNVKKNYAITSLPMQKRPLPDEKSSIFTILQKPDFRLRYVNEFIYLSEKVRIFEFNLDDRALEVIKYNYIIKPLKISINSKIILTGADCNALVFTVYDGYDKPVATHHIGIDAYARICLETEKEIIIPPVVKWRKIDLNWAKQKGDQL